MEGASHSFHSRDAGGGLSYNIIYKCGRPLTLIRLEPLPLYIRHQPVTSPRTLQQTRTEYNNNKNTRSTHRNTVLCTSEKNYCIYSKLSPSSSSCSHSFSSSGVAFHRELILLLFSPSSRSRSSKYGGHIQTHRTHTHSSLTIYDNTTIYIYNVYIMGLCALEQVPTYILLYIAKYDDDNNKNNMTCCAGFVFALTHKRILLYIL